MTDKICYICNNPDKGRELDPHGETELCPVGEGRKLICWLCFESGSVELKAIVDKHVDEDIDKDPKLAFKYVMTDMPTGEYHETLLQTNQDQEKKSV